MAWSLLDSGGAGFSDGAGGHVFSFPNTFGHPSAAANAGDLLVLLVSSDDVTSTPALWTLAISDLSNLGAYAFYKVATGGELSVTITTGSNTPAAIGFLRYSGAGATPLDVTAAAHNVVSASATPAVSTATLATTGELAIATAHLGGLQGAVQTSPTWSTGYTNRVDAMSGSTGATDQHVFVADKTTAGTAAESPSASWTGPTNAQAVTVVTFKPASGGTQTGSATLTGTGTAAAAAKLTIPAASALAASGTAAAAGSQTIRAAATLAGSGTLGAAGSQTIRATAALAATGAITSAGAVKQLATASLAAIGTLATSAAGSVSGAAALAATGSMIASGSTGGRFVIRPDTGTITRPGSGLVARPNSGLVTRP